MGREVLALLDRNRPLESRPCVEGFGFEKEIVSSVSWSYVRSFGLSVGLSVVRCSLFVVRRA